MELADMNGCESGGSGNAYLETVRWVQEDLNGFLPLEGDWHLPSDFPFYTEISLRVDESSSNPNDYVMELEDSYCLSGSRRQCRARFDPKRCLLIPSPSARGEMCVWFMVKCYVPLKRIRHHSFCREEVRAMIERLYWERRCAVARRSVIDTNSSSPRTSSSTSSSASLPTCSSASASFNPASPASSFSSFLPSCKSDSLLEPNVLTSAAPPPYLILSHGKVFSTHPYDIEQVLIPQLCLLPLRYFKTFSRIVLKKRENMLRLDGKDYNGETSTVYVMDAPFYSYHDIIFCDMTPQLWTVLNLPIFSPHATLQRMCYNTIFRNRNILGEQLMKFPQCYGKEHLPLPPIPREYKRRIEALYLEAAEVVKAGDGSSCSQTNANRDGCGKLTAIEYSSSEGLADLKGNEEGSGRDGNSSWEGIRSLKGVRLFDEGCTLEAHYYSTGRSLYVR